MERLTHKTLLASGYDGFVLPDAPERVIQFGEGNFLRGFFDYFLHKMNEAGLYDGKAVVVQPRQGGKCGPLNAQKCAYNLYARGLENGKVVQEHKYIQSIARCVDPYLDFAGF